MFTSNSNRDWGQVLIPLLLTTAIVGGGALFAFV